MNSAIVTSILALVAGVAIGYFTRKQQAMKEVDSAEHRAEAIIADAKIKERDILLQTRDKALKLIDDARKEEELRRKELQAVQQRVEKRESLFDQKLIELQEKQQKIQDKGAQIDQLKAEAESIKEAQSVKLEAVAGMSREAAQQMLIEKAEKEAHEIILERVKKIETTGIDEVNARAQVMIADAMQRYAQSVVSENTTTNVQLTSDDMKGRIIGKEGRNIRTLEQLTGVEILVDDTPNAITLSGFNLIRRHIAKRTIEKLMHDGRIHPGRIEEYVEQSKLELAADVKKAGEEAAYEMGVTGLDPRLVQILGRLKYRTSFGQNALTHSLEVGHLAGLLAQQLGGNVSVCKKGGLLHDIGKAVDHEVEGGHPQIGYELLKKFNLPEEIAYQCIAHHEDAPKTLEGIIVKVADALSASRPGARRDNAERYLQRVTELEGIATGFEGVDKAYAIQAGRELRVFAAPNVVDDAGAYRLAKAIAQRIQETLNYPGEVKVTLIREKRVIEFAR